MTDAKKIEIAVIFGPTACGKSELAAQFAAKADGEVISADSMQIYSKLSIGTAKPTQEQLALAPHHLVGTVSPQERYTVADYTRDAHQAVSDIVSRGKLPVFAGGTGMYISSLVEGISYSETASDEQIRLRLNREANEKGLGSLYDRLSAADSETAAHIHPNDRRRIVRALEYLEISGEPISKQVERSHKQNPYLPRLYYMNYPEREQLYARCNARVDGMLEAGLKNEAKLVWDNRTEYAGVLQAIGYKEFFPYFEGVSDLDSCVQLLKQRTRNYAKRQISWFNRFESAQMLNAALPVEELLNCLLQNR